MRIFTWLRRQTAWVMLLCFTCCAAAAAAPANNIGKFWHVTDFHYDHTYWTTQRSCNADVKNQSMFGNYWCDAPWKLVTSAIGAMSSYASDVDFLIWTGDTVAHIKDDYMSVDINMEILKNLTSALKDAFPDKKVYASYGNHDYYPTNQFPNVNNIIYNRTAEMWKSWIEEAAQLDNFRKGGYYTRQLSSGLRIVALNTNLYYTSNKQTTNTQDPADQVQWLRNVLETARNASEKVILTAHIPPGVHTPSRVVWFQERHQQLFMSALQDYAEVIVAMHYGHDHQDGFKVFYDKKDDPAIPLFVAPSVTPWRYKIPSGTGPPHNPSVRLVTYDRNTGKHLNIKQLSMNLTEAIATGVANFTLLYSFTEHYKVPDLSVQSLQNLVTRMQSQTQGDQLVADYFRFSTAGAVLPGRTCDVTCQARIRCGLTHYYYKGFDECVKNYTSSSSGLLPFAAAILLMVLTSLHLSV